MGPWLRTPAITVLSPDERELLKKGKKKKKERELLTEVFQRLFDLLGCEVNVGIWRNEGCMEPVVVVITVDGVGS